MLWRCLDPDRRSIRMSWHQHQHRNDRSTGRACVLALTACCILDPMMVPAQSNSAVRMLGATPANSSNLTLRWQGGTPPFRLQKTTDGGRTWIDSTPDIFSNSYTVPIESRAPGVVLFRVRTMPDTTPPPVPTSVFGVAPTCHEIRVAWWPVSDVGSSGLWGYPSFQLSPGHLFEREDKAQNSGLYLSLMGVFGACF